MANLRPGCVPAWAAGRYDFSGGAAGRHYVHYPRLRPLRLPLGLLSPPMLLAGRTAAVESLQPLRRSLSGAVEHAGPLPAFADLPAAALDMVIVVLLSAAPGLVRTGDVFPGLSLDEPAAGGRVGGGHLRIQWVVVECPDVAEQFGRARLAAVG